MSQSSQAQSEEEENRTPMDTFQMTCDQYYSVVNETSPEFLKEKALIEQSFQRKFDILHNYLKEKLSYIRKEASFIQQMEEDSVISQNLS